MTWSEVVNAAHLKLKRIFKMKIITRLTKQTSKRRRKDQRQTFIICLLLRCIELFYFCLLDIIWITNLPKLFWLSFIFVKTSQKAQVQYPSNFQRTYILFIYLFCRCISREKVTFLKSQVLFSKYLKLISIHSYWLDLDQNLQPYVNWSYNMSALE